MGASLPISAITSLMGTVTSTIGTITSSREEAASHRMAAKSSAFEAGLERIKAEREEAIIKAKTARMMGTQKALFASAGVDPTSGTPLAIMFETALEGEREARAAWAEGEHGYTRKINEAVVSRMYGKRTEREGWGTAMSTFFTGLQRAGSNYETWKARK